MTVYSLSGLLIAITSGLMVALMLFIGKKKLHYLWALFCFAVFLFGFGVYLVGGALTPEDATFFWKLAHVGAIFIPVLFLNFVYEFLEEQKTKVLIVIYSISFFLLLTDFVDGLFIGNMRFVFNEFYFDSPPGMFYPLYTILFFGLTAYSHLLLWRGFKNSKDKIVKDKIKFFFFGMGVSFAGGGFNFLPVYGIDIYPFMNMTVFLYPLILTYAIIKHQLFDIKLIFVELAILSLNLFLFINIFTSHSVTDYVLNISVSFVLLVFSIYLVLGIYKEIRDRERIEELVWQKAQANDRLRQMEAQKTEFVSIASHQLRTPLTVIKGYASMILEGTFGTLNDQAREAMGKLFVATEKVIALVEDLLTVSRIEQGRLILNFETVNFRNYIQDALVGMEKEARDAKIYLSFSMEEAIDSFVSVDKQKFKQATRRIIENAIKYSTAPGFVSVIVSFDKVANKSRLIVSDMGEGMTQAQIDDVFKRFDLETIVVTDPNAQTRGAVPESRGHGIGLYIAQEIIKAHHGVLRIESAGHNNGTTVVVELSAVPPQEGVQK